MTVPQPERGSRLVSRLGHSQNQAHCWPAAGYFRPNASGNQTPGNFAARSFSQSWRDSFNCSRSAECRLVGSMVTRSLSPLPLRTVISPRPEVDVLDPQPKTFHQPHAAAVEQLRDHFHRNCPFREQPVRIPHASGQPVGGTDAWPAQNPQDRFPTRRGIGTQRR